MKFSSVGLNSHNYSGSNVNENEIVVDLGSNLRKTYELFSGWTELESRMEILGSSKDR